MQSRRKFIRNAALGSAALAAAPALSFGANGGARLKDIGYISGILKNEFEKYPWRDVLKKSVEFGFTEYEGGMKGDSPKEFLSYCKEIGLKPVAGGFKMAEDMDKVQQDFDQLNELKMKYAVTYWPWLVGTPFKLDDCKKSSELLNKIGEKAKKNGLTLCWHNHDHEFKEMEEGKPFDYLMQHTDEDLVFCEMDIYWVAKGGADPLEYLKKYKGRYKILHVKDMDNDPDKTYTCPGSGIIDFGPVFKEAKKQGIDHYMVERDKIVDGYECLESSGEYLQNLRF